MALLGLYIIIMMDNLNKPPEQLVEWYSGRDLCGPGRIELVSPKWQSAGGPGLLHF